MNRSEASKRGKTSTKTRGSTAAASIRFGRPQPTREIKPAQIHEMRMKTLQIQNQIKLQRTQLNRLKDKITSKTEAINRTVNQKSEDTESKTIHQVTTVQLQRSIEAAENRLENIQTELEKAQYDDRTACYQEVEEELKVTFLEYDRIQGDITSSRDEARHCEDRLKATDARASQRHITDLELAIDQIKAANAALREKWNAYQIKMHKMNIETRIVKNREEGKNGDVTLKEADKEANAVVRKLEKLDDELAREEAHYHKHVEEIMEIIDNQRRRIVEHLMGVNGQQ